MDSNVLKRFIPLPATPTAALEVEIQRKNWENEKLLKDINDLKNTLLSAIGVNDDLL